MWGDWGEGGEAPEQGGQGFQSMGGLVWSLGSALAQGKIGSKSSSDQKG